MNKTSIFKWLENHNNQGIIHPPGCEDSIVAHPIKNECCNAGIVHEHRFAFYFWGLYHLENSLENSFSKTILISIDSHDDVGVPNEVVPEDLDNLNLKNNLELGLFSWLRLRKLNDGHILPALYLDFFSDAYILLNTQNTRKNFKQKDINDSLHSIKYFNNIEDLLSVIPLNCKVFIDIDLDYFARENHEAGLVLGSEYLIPDDEIRSFLAIDGQIFSTFLDRIAGITIALEPRYCGGFANSLHVFNILNEELFDGTLCTSNCKWKSKS
ncbi:hypothetical protein MHK_006279 [Candidatus Magnetomorum sp. HK-1]|nr:hypothetical protein MHK_006279 [Candidatus Magnetomorum sp. HK-1]